MSYSESEEKELLKTILPPLLDDFVYWFSRSAQLLQTERLAFISPQEQSDLLSRVEQAQQEVNCARLLFDATDQQAGVTMQVVASWHQLVAECWGLAQRHRQEKS